MTIFNDPDHYERAIKSLVPPLWGKPRIAAMIDSWIAEVEELDAAIWAVVLSRLIDSAENVQLSMLGRIVGAGRTEYAETPGVLLSDADYRLVLKAAIAANDSMTDQASLAAVVQEITSVGYTIVDGADASFSIGLEEPVALLVQLSESLRKAKAAGVAGVVGAPPAGTEGFWYQDQDGTDDPEKLGYADLDNPSVEGGAYLNGYDL